MSKINKHGGIHGADGKFTGHVGGQPVTGLPNTDSGWLEDEDLEQLAETPQPATLDRALEGWVTPPESDFQQRFTEHFGPAADFADQHPDWDYLSSDGRLYELSGTRDTNLGRERGIDLIDGEEIGKPGQLYVEITTRNGGSERECWGGHEPDDPCTGCVMDEIIEHPQHVYDTDSFGDALIYFSVPDQDGAKVSQEAREHRTRLQQLQQITEGTMTPWWPVPGSSNDEAKNRAKTLRKRVLSLEYHSATAEVESAAADRIQQVLDSTQYPKFNDLIEAAGGWGYDPKRGDLNSIVSQLTLRTNQYDYQLTINSLREARKKLADGHKVEAEAPKVLAVLDSDSPLRPVITKAVDEARESRDRRQKLEQHFSKDLNERLEPLRRYAHDRAGLDAQSMLAEAKDLEKQVEDLQASINWPGDPNTAPRNMDEARNGHKEEQ